MLSVVLGACGSEETKRARFFDKGKALFEAGDYVKARLEFKNALQIDPKFAEAYYMLGMTELKEGNVKQAYGLFVKTVELDPALLDPLNTRTKNCAPFPGRPLATDTEKIPSST